MPVVEMPYLYVHFYSKRFKEPRLSTGWNGCRQGLVLLLLCLLLALTGLRLALLLLRFVLELLLLAHVENGKRRVYGFRRRLDTKIVTTPYNPNACPIFYALFGEIS